MRNKTQLETMLRFMTVCTFTILSAIKIVLMKEVLGKESGGLSGAIQEVWDDFGRKSDELMRLL